MESLLGGSLLSPTNPTIRKLLDALKRPAAGGDDCDDKWAEKAVRALAKKLRRTNLIEVLARAVEKEDVYSPCVPITRSLDGRVQVSSRKCVPHMTYCRLWRWPDLASAHSLQSVPHCQYPAGKKLDQLCVNPYHYVKVEQAAVIQSLTQRAAAAVKADGKAMRPVGKTMVDGDEPMHEDDRERTSLAILAAALDNGPSPIDDLYPSNVTLSADDYMSEDAESVAACSPPTAAPPPGTEALDALESLVGGEAHKEPEHWCTVSYYELNQRVGEPFHAGKDSFVVDGYCNPSSDERFCLGTLSNVNRSSSVVEARKHIASGARLYRRGDEVFAECLSEAAIFVQSAISNQRRGWTPATVVKILPGCTMKIFDNRQFYNTLKTSVAQGFEAAYCLTRMCTVRVSFIKGWGAEYRRQLVTATPCWVEVHLNGALQWLDRVISKLPCPQSYCTSNS